MTKKEKSIQDASFTEILFLTRELRFAVSLIQSAMEETELLDLVINDPSSLMFLMLSSQGVERLLKLVFSYDTIINEKTDTAFSPKNYGHKITKLYKHIKNISIPKEAKQQYKKLFEEDNLKTELFILFSDLLEKFNSEGRYYFTSKTTRKDNKFSYYFDEMLVELIHNYQNLKIYEKKHKFKKYQTILKETIEQAKMHVEDYKKIVPKLFCINIEEKPIRPYWDSDSHSKEGATNDFKETTREFLLLFILPIITILESQFLQISKIYKTTYYFNELTDSIKFTTQAYKYKKHRSIKRDAFSALLL